MKRYREIHGVVYESPKRRAPRFCQNHWRDLRAVLHVCECYNKHVGPCRCECGVTRRPKRKKITQ